MGRQPANETPCDSPNSQMAIKEGFRNYEEGARHDIVSNNYYNNHKFQTMEFVKKQHENHFRFNKGEMTIWEAMEFLNQIVDESDMDTSATQIQHCLQTAEAIRKIMPNEEWLIATGLVHDLGKILTHPSIGQPQWATVGDTFPLGCKFSDKNVFHKYFEDNPDFHDPRYNTEHGIYEPGCGLMNVTMSFGHDEYMYQVLKNNPQVTLPDAGLYIIRFHSFYPWHQGGAYTWLMNEYDHEMLKHVKTFQKFDLYSKHDDSMDVEALKPYYEALINKFFPGKLKW